MFEKFYQYSKIKRKNLSIVINRKSTYINKDLTINGICINNPKLLKPNTFKYTFDNIFHCLCIHVNEYPKFLSKSFYIISNGSYRSEPLDGFIIYLPYRVIESLHIREDDIQSKFMLYWVGMYIDIPKDIINYIYEFIKGSFISIPVINLIESCK